MFLMHFPQKSEIELTLTDWNITISILHRTEKRDYGPGALVCDFTTDKLLDPLCKLLGVQMHWFHILIYTNGF